MEVFVHPLQKESISAGCLPHDDEILTAFPLVETLPLLAALTYTPSPGDTPLGASASVVNATTDAGCMPAGRVSIELISLVNTLKFLQESEGNPRT